MSGDIWCKLGFHKWVTFGWGTLPYDDEILWGAVRLGIINSFKVCENCLKGKCEVDLAPYGTPNYTWLELSVAREVIRRCKTTEDKEGKIVMHM